MAKKKCISPITGAEMGVRKDGTRVKPNEYIKRRRRLIYQDLVSDFHEDYKQFGRNALERLRSDNPGKYFDIALKIIPQDVEGPTKSELAELIRAVQENREQVEGAQKAFSKTVVNEQRKPN